MTDSDGCDVEEIRLDLTSGSVHVYREDDGTAHGLCRVVCLAVERHTGYERVVVKVLGTGKFHVLTLADFARCYPPAAPQPLPPVSEKVVNLVGRNPPGQNPEV